MNTLNTIPRPFVYLVDSPSNQDLYSGYSIGMALRDALNSINIPCIYRLATNSEMFNFSMNQGLSEAINQFQTQPNVHSYPFIHFCSHGNPDGIALTNADFINWQQLRQSLMNHNIVKGYNPYICMASCNGFDATKMVNAFDSVFNLLIGNTGVVLKSDLTVGYLSFYNHFFYKQATFDQAVQAMRVASGDHNFFYTIGEDVKNQILAQVNPPQPCI